MNALENGTGLDPGSRRVRRDFRTPDIPEG